MRIRSAIAAFWTRRDTVQAWRSELCVVVGVILVSALFGFVYLDRWGDPPKAGYRFWADPAVGVAMGKGLSKPAPESAPEIEEFLAKKRPGVDLSSIPPDCPVKEYGRGSGRRAYLYLINTVGWSWAWFGMSWKVLLPLHAVFWGATCACVYGLFRLGANRFLSLLGTLLFLLGPNHLVISALLRDYAKAPFILGCILLMGILLKKGRTPRIVLLIAASIGVVAGIGIGFREDVQICLVPAALMLTLFLPRQEWRPILVRVAAVLVMAAVYVGTGWPILKAMNEGSGGTAHPIAGGLAKPCAAQMQVISTDYQMVPVFNDGFIASTIQSFAHANLKVPERIPYSSLRYNEMGMEMLKRYAVHFPADCLRRVWASIAVTALKTPFLYGDPEFRTNPFIDRYAPWLLRIYWPLQSIMPGIILAILLIALFRDLRLGLGLLFLFVYFTAYPVLQFHYRHLFHLGFLYWWFPAVLLQIVGSRVWQFAKDGSWKRPPVAFRWPEKIPWKSILPPVAVLAMVLVGVAGAYEIAWQVQQARYVQLMTRYETVPLQALETEVSPDTRDGFPWTRLHPKALFPAECSENERLWKIRNCYLVAEFQGCPVPIPIYCMYNKKDRPSDFSAEYSVIPAKNLAEKNRFFIPIYDDIHSDTATVQESHFLGLSIPEAAFPYFRGLYKAELGDYELPLFISVPEDWRSRPTPHLQGAPRKP